MEDEVGLREGDRLRAQQPQRLLLARGLQQRGNRIDVDRIRLVPHQPQQHGLVAAVALAGGAERAVEVRRHARGGGEPAFGQAQREQPRRAHRPDGVRTRGPMPTLKRSKTETAMVA